MTRKRIDVTSENKTGRNKKFHDNYDNIDMTRNKFVEKIKKGDYPKYHVRIINGIETPISNPDIRADNNLN